MEPQPEPNSAATLVLRLGNTTKTSRAGDLDSHGFSTWVFDHGSRFESVVNLRAWPMILLEVPCVDSRILDAVQRVRAAYCGPVAVLARQADQSDQLRLLEHGLDEVLVEPVQTSLLVARLRRILRDDPPRDSREAAATLFWKVGDLTIDPARREACYGPRALCLTDLEFELLALLARHAGSPLSREQIYRTLRGIPYNGRDRAVDLHVSRLRRKLAREGLDPKLILTIRGIGYQLAPPSL